MQSRGAGPNVITLNDWNFVAAVYDQSSGARRIYVNGAMVAERTDPPITLTDSIADLAIGGHLASPTSLVTAFPGLIDEVEIFNRALSASEIRSIFDAGSAGKSKPPAPKSDQNLVSASPRGSTSACPRGHGLFPLHEPKVKVTGWLVPVVFSMWRDKRR